MQPRLEMILEMELEYEQLRQAGDWQSALPRLDQVLQKSFALNGDPPDNLADLSLVAMLAVQKGRLLQEITTVILVNGETGELSPTMPSERRQEFTEQSLNWLQIGLAATQKALAHTTAEPGSPWQRFLHHQLVAIRRGFLAVHSGDQAELLKRHLPLIRHLFSLLWMGGDLAGAEDLLYLLGEIEGMPEMKVTGQTFYQELLKLPDNQLEAGGLPRTEILAALADWDMTPPPKA